MAGVWYVAQLSTLLETPLMHRVGTPDDNDYAKHPMNPETPAIYEEDIGLNGPISKLPGNNPVFVKP